MPAPFRPRTTSRSPLTELQVDRPECEPRALDHRSLEPRDDVTAPPGGGQRELEPPWCPGLLDRLDASELLLEALGDVLGLLLLTALAVPTVLPLPHLPSLLPDPAPFVDVADVLGFVPLARPTPLPLELTPPARELAHRSRLRLELDDARHPLEQGSIVRHDHQPSAVTVEKPLEQLEPGEVEVVRRLVEQEDVGVGGEDRLQPCPRSFAARQSQGARTPARDTRHRAPAAPESTSPSQVPRDPRAREGASTCRSRSARRLRCGSPVSR